MNCQVEHGRGTRHSTSKPRIRSGLTHGGLTFTFESQLSMCLNHFAKGRRKDLIQDSGYTENEAFIPDFR